MPATAFICPDGRTVRIKDCLAKCDNRCLSLRTLRAIAQQREWTGKPSTTQLLKGTREAYLELVTDYAISPDAQLFRVHGSKAHAYLEQFAEADEYNEERIHDQISSGMFDFYDPVSHTLYDTKTSGSYKIMRVLGLYSVDVPTGGVYKSGKKKGQLRTRKEMRTGGAPDRLDWAVQLNDYRMKVEQVLPRGYTVNRMQIEALVRDGNTYIADSRGITRNGYLITINKISDHWVGLYMRVKANRLHAALDTGIIPPECNHRETWGGRKCEKYCNVREICAQLPAAGGVTIKEVLGDDRQEQEYLPEVACGAG